MIVSTQLLNLDHGIFMEKVMESHEILTCHKDTNPVEFMADFVFFKESDKKPSRDCQLRL